MTTIVCNDCYKRLNKSELAVYPLQWQHSGDMYCSKHETRKQFRQATKYVKGTVNIATRSGKIEVQATIAVGTGLAYHVSLTEYSAQHATYTITHVHTGLALASTSKVREARQAIEKIVSNDLVDWTQDNPTANMSTADYQATKEMIRGIQS
jgi:hypothetical protein